MIANAHPVSLTYYPDMDSKMKTDLLGKTIKIGNKTYRVRILPIKHNTHEKRILYLQNIDNAHDNILDPKEVKKLIGKK